MDPGGFGRLQNQAPPTIICRAAAWWKLTCGAVFLQVHGSLEGLGSQPVWQQEDAAGSAGGGALPSFSAYPQQRVTAAGEYLMMMPQTLEGLLGPGNVAEDQMDSEWLDKVECPSVLNQRCHHVESTSGDLKMQ